MHSLAINPVAIKTKQNITFEIGIYHFYTIIRCVFLFSLDEIEWGHKEN